MADIKNPKLNQNVKKLRNELGMTQQEFADKFNVNRGVVAKIETGEINVTDRNIKSICDSFDVKETWLRTGEGEIFEKINPDNSIINMATNALKQDKKSFQKDFLYLLSQLNEDQWSSLEDVMDIMIKNIKDNKNGNDKA